MAKVDTLSSHMEKLVREFVPERVDLVSQKVQSASEIRPYPIFLDGVGSSIFHDPSKHIEFLAELSSVGHETEWLKIVVHAEYVHNVPVDLMFYLTEPPHKQADSMIHVAALHGC